MSTENIVSGKKYRILTDVTNKVWSRISFWSKASDVEANDGKDLETKIGSVDGITDSLNSTSSRIAASAKAVNTLNNSLVSNIYVGSDGKLHKVIGGADTVLPFSGDSAKIGKFTINKSNGTHEINLGFKPKFMCVYAYADSSNSFCYVYHEDYSETKYFRGVTGTSSWKNLGGPSGSNLTSINSDGFTFTNTQSTYDGKEATYIAY